MKEIDGFPKYYITEDGRVFSEFKGGRFLKSWSSFGFQVSTLNNGRAQVKKNIHMLVANAYLSNPMAHRNVIHMNGDRTDNHKDNLKWIGRREYLEYRLIMGRHSR